MSDIDRQYSNNVSKQAADFVKSDVDGSKHADQTVTGTSDTNRKQMKTGLDTSRHRSTRETDAKTEVHNGTSQRTMTLTVFGVLMCLLAFSFTFLNMLAALLFLFFGVIFLLAGFIEHQRNAANGTQYSNNVSKHADDYVESNNVGGKHADQTVTGTSDTNRKLMKTGLDTNGYRPTRVIDTETEVHNGTSQRTMTLTVFGVLMCLLAFSFTSINMLATLLFLFFGVVFLLAGFIEHQRDVAIESKK